MIGIVWGGWNIMTHILIMSTKSNETGEYITMSK